MDNNLNMNKTKILNVITGLTISLLAAFIAIFANVEYSLWIVFFMTISVFIFYYIKKKLPDSAEARVLFRICFAAFALRVLIVIVTNLIPSLLVPNDSVQYEAEGLRIANGWSSGHLFFNLPASHFFYYLQNAVVYFLFGFYPSLVIIINCLLGILAGVNIYLATNEVFGKAAAKIAAVLTLFYTSILFHQTMNLKEAMVVFLLTLIIRDMILLYKKATIKKLFIILIYSILLTLTRNYAGIFMAVVACVYFLIVSKYGILKKIIIAFVALTAVGFVTYKANMGVFGINMIRLFSLDFIDRLRRSEYLGGSEVLQNISMSKLSDLPKYIPIALAYFLFSPFPWQLAGSALQFFSLGENIIWYVLFVFFPVGVWLMWKKHRAICITLLCILFGFCALYTLQMSNMGLAYRMKASILPIFFIFIAAGIAWGSEKFITKRFKVES